MFGVLIALGFAAGLFIAAMAHPAFYKMVFGGKRKSADTYVGDDEG